MTPTLNPLHRRKLEIVRLTSPILPGIFTSLTETLTRPASSGSDSTGSSIPVNALDSLDAPTQRIRGSAPQLSSQTPDSYFPTAVVDVDIQRLEKASCFSQFELIQELGRGTFGTVHLAKQLDMAGRTVVLKIGRHLKDETETLAQLQHPNIVPVYSFHRDEHRQAVCMPFVGTVTVANVVRRIRESEQATLDGKALRTIITHCRTERPVNLPTDETARPATSPGTPPHPTVAAESDATVVSPINERFERLAGYSFVDAVLWIARQLARGLAAAHDRHIIHSDLKPANILLADDGQPMLLDFGVAYDRKLHDQSLRIGGTRPYMSPEHLDSFLKQEPSFDERSDVYSLGVILFEMLTGRLPFNYSHGHHEEMIRQEIMDRKSLPVLSAKGRHFSPAVNSIIQTCLAFDPAKRYPSARALEEDLTRQLERKPLAYAANSSCTELATKWVSRNRWPLAAATVLLSGAAGAFGYERHDRERRQTLANVAAERRADELLVRFHSWQTALLGSPEERFTVLTQAPVEISSLIASVPETKKAESRDQAIDLLLSLSRAALQQTQGDRGEWLTKSAEWNRQAGELLATVSQPRATRVDGQNLMERGQWKNASSTLAKAMDTDPSDFWAAFSLGQCKYRMGRDAEAITAFDKAAAIDPSVNGVYFNRGLASLRLRKFEDAEADFTKVIDFKPDWADPYLNRANAREGKGDFEGAIRDFTAALDRGYSSSSVLLARSRVYAKAGHADKAAADRQAGIAAEPTDDRGFCARGGARMPAKGITDAVAFAPALADFEKALAINPKSLVALQMKARIFSITRQNTKAIAALTDLLTHYPETADALSGRAMLFSREGDRKAAHADAVEALRISGDNPRTVYQLAGVYAMTSKSTPDDAREALALLSSALRNNFGFEHLADDRELDPIRRHPDFDRTIADAKRFVSTLQTNQKSKELAQ